MNPGCDWGHLGRVEVAKQMNRGLIETMDRLDSRNQGLKQFRTPFQQRFRHEVEIVLVPKARNNLLSHITYDPPGYVGDQKDTWLSAHPTCSCLRNLFTALTAQVAKRLGSQKGDGHSRNDSTMYRSSSLSLFSRAINPARHSWSARIRRLHAQRSKPCWPSSSVVS